MLHPVDLATNKASAAAGRREVRDIVDLTIIHETILPLGALIWAAIEKTPGFTPEAMIAEIRRNANYPRVEWESLQSAAPIDPGDIVRRLRAGLEQAEAFVTQMPSEKAGLLFLDGDRVVQPDPAALHRYTEHCDVRRGHWPSSPEIAAAMMARFAGGEH